MLEFRDSLVRRLLREKFHGAHNLIQGWPENCQPPDRTTLWRWLKGGHPGSAEMVLGLAAALDIDPLGLFETSRNDFAVLCNRLARSIAKERNDILGPEQKWILDFFAPNEDWPPDLMKYFGRVWKRQSFRHDARKSLERYQRVEITAVPRRFSQPQIWHFAFRDPSAILPTWTPYGLIERAAGQVSLYHVRGHTDSGAIPPNATSFLFETWFGPRPAEFLVASLHPFAIALADSVEATPLVRFP